MNKSLKIDILAYNSLDKIKSDEAFKSFSDCVLSMCNFFKHNKISPRELLNDNFSQTLLDFKNEILINFKNLNDNNNNNTERVIKIERRFEIDYFKPMNIKLIDIHKSSTQIHNDNSNEKKFEDLKDNSKELLELKNQLINSEKELNKKIELINIIEKNNKEYHRCLETLNKSMKVELVGNTKRPYIDLPVDEAEELFYLIP